MTPQTQQQCSRLLTRRQRLGALANIVADIAYTDPAGAWSFTAAGLNSFVLQMFGLLLGFGFAALILNTPGAIVAYFALPTALMLLTELVPWFGDNVGQWLVSRPGSGGDRDRTRRMWLWLRRGSSTQRPGSGRYGCITTVWPIVTIRSWRLAAMSESCWPVRRTDRAC